MPCIRMVFDTLKEGDFFLDLRAMQLVSRQQLPSDSIYAFQKISLDKGRSDVGYTMPFESSHPVLKLPFHKDIALN